MPLVHYIVRDNQMVVAVDRRLHVVTDDAGPAAARCHRARIRIGQRYLLVGSFREFLADSLELPHLFANGGDLLLELLHPLLGDQGGIAVGAVKLGQIPSDALFEVLPSRFELVRSEVLVPVVHRLELAPVDHCQRLPEQPDLTAKLDKLRADFADPRAIVAAEVGDRFKVRCQTPREPDQLQVALRLSFEPTA